MPDLTRDDLLAGFTAPRPYTWEVVERAPSTPGVHVVLDRDIVVYVGWTGNLRRRMRQHLTGNRDSSVLHDQVGHLLDTPGNVASAADVSDWLGQHTVRWQETDYPQSLKERLIIAWRPRFNRQVPKPRRR